MSIWGTRIFIFWIDYNDFKFDRSTERKMSHVWAHSNAIYRHSSPTCSQILRSRDWAAKGKISIQRGNPWNNGSSHDGVMTFSIIGDFYIQGHLCGHLMSLLPTWINSWINNRVGSGLTRRKVHVTSVYWDESLTTNDNWISIYIFTCIMFSQLKYMCKTDILLACWGTSIPDCSLSRNDEINIMCKSQKWCSQNTIYSF